jgi:hypothetical protein
MEIQIPMTENHQELAGGKIVWTGKRGRILSRIIHFVFDDKVSGKLVLTVLARKLNDTVLEEGFTLTRKIFK